MGMVDMCRNVDIRAGARGTGATVGGAAPILMTSFMPLGRMPLSVPDIKLGFNIIVGAAQQTLCNNERASKLKAARNEGTVWVRQQEARNLSKP